MKKLLQILMIAVFLVIHSSLSGQVHDFNRSVRFVISELSDGSKTLNWTQEANATAYTIRRRTAGTGNFSVIGNLPGDATSYTDNNVQKTLTYEYEVRKTINVSGASITSPGYLYGGNAVPPIHQRGYYLILAESTAFAALESKLGRLKNDLEMDGWVVQIKTVERDTPVPAVKNIIKEVYQETGAKLSTVFLFGRIPVPYSGVIRPDGHADHEGAWPADVYYADMDGLWTDNIANSTVASNSRHHNIPDDGKFDQSVLPSDVELEIGRVDFFDMPAFSKTEIELLEAYLDKNHEFRNGRIIMPRRGIIQNNFGGFEEAFGQTALNNFTRFFGIDSVRYGEYRNTLRTNPYLWSYGCGGGSYTSASGITNTANLTVDSLQTVFTALFGSYFGDWDSRNNLLRAALGSGTTLTNAWAGRPHWYFQHMAMGRHIGFSTRLTQNNSLYPSGFGGRMIHIALMGEPGLTMYPYRAIDDVGVAVDKNTLSVNVVSDHQEGFYYYIKKAHEDKYTLINDEPTIEKSLQLDCLDKGEYQLMVRAVKKEENASGNFMNLSIGRSTAFTIESDARPTIDFDFQLDFDLLTATSFSQNADSLRWQVIGQQVVESTDQNIQILLDDLSSNRLCLLASNECAVDTLCKNLPQVVSSLPQVVTFFPTLPTCFGFNDGRISLFVSGGAPPFEVIWSNGFEGMTLEGVGAGEYAVTITSRTGKSGSASTTLTQPTELIADVMINYTPDQSSNQVNINISGGSPPYRAAWSDGFEGIQRMDVTSGDYIVQITDDKGCVTEIVFNILPVSAKDLINQQIGFDIQVLQGDNILVLFSETTIQPIKALIYSVDSKLMLSDNIPVLTSAWRISGINWPSGIYILDIEAAGRHTAKKFFKP
jgi:hypothetical protein